MTNRLVAHRLAGTVSEDVVYDEKTGLTKVTVAAKEYNTMTVGESVIAANKKEQTEEEKKAEADKKAADDKAAEDKKAADEAAAAGGGGD